MALNPTTLSTLIYSALTSDSRNGFSDPLSTDQQNMVKAICDAIASSVVAHVTSSAVVTVASVSGVQTGAGVSGPGTGTIS